MDVDSLDYPLWDGSTLLSSSEGQGKFQAADCHTAANPTDLQKAPRE